MFHLDRSFEDVLSSLHEFRVRRVCAGDDMICFEVDSSFAVSARGTCKVVEEETVKLRGALAKRENEHKPP